MRQHKDKVYSPHGAALPAYAMVLLGLEQADTTATLERLCRRAARRQGLAGWPSVLQAFRADLSAILARRASAMWRACALDNSRR